MLNAAATKPVRRPRYTRAGTELPRGIDGRSISARRYRVILETLEAEYGGGAQLSEAVRGGLRQLAAIQLREENLQSLIINGDDSIVADEIIRLSSEGRRIRASLEMKAEQAKPTGQSLRDYIATAYPAKAGAEPADEEPEPIEP